MEAAAATAIRTSSNMSGESPVATNRDASQTPGRDPMQYQPAEIITNGVHVNGADNIGRTSPPTAVPMPPLIQPPSASPLSSQLPPSGQTPSAPVSSSQPLKHPPSKQSPSIQLPSVGPPPAPHDPSVLHSPVVSQPAPQPHQHYRGPPSSTAPPSSIPPSSQPGHPRQQSREMNGVQKRFPSPESDHNTRIPRFKRDLSILADAVQQSCPEAVRRIVRDKWEKCITGSEFHHAFLMNAIIHHASGIIMRRAIHDFGQTMVSEAKQEIASCLSSQDLDDIAPTIFEKCSDKFLDMALEQRLKTIDARSLINALARAERLGYESGDILEDRPERVVLATQSPRATQANLSINTQSRPPPAAPAEASLLFQTQPAQHTPATGDLTCRLCWRGFQNTKTYEYHVQKQLCKKADSDQYHYWCEDCGSGFTTKSSQQYHRSNAVCGAHTTAAATPQRIPGSGMFPSTKPLKYAHYVPHTPTLPDPIPIQTPSPSQGDPYRHLTPQRRAELDDELRQLELSYVPRFKEAEEMADLMARRAKLDSLHNTFSTRQSSIRKKYGVRLRVRRTRAEINEERSRMGLKHSTSATAETPSAKRQRSDDGSNNLGQSYVSRSPQARTPNPPTNHLPVSQMNNSGLGGSIATAATTDPTVSVAPNQLSSTDEQPPPNTLSSLQRKGYRVSSHVGQATQPDSCSTIQRTGSSSTPVVLDDSSDGTDTDEDIPSTLPPKKNL